MAAKKRKSRKKARARLGYIAAGLFVLIVLFFQAVNFLDSPSGRAFLLDLGFDSKYSAVQIDINERIIRTLMENGVKRSSMEVIPGAEGDSYLVRAPLPANRSLVKLNIALDRAVEGIGARIRECREGRDGEELDFRIGTGRRMTHRCIVRKTAAAGRADSRIAIVVDDFGYSYNGAARGFIDLDAGITISVIPGLKYSRQVCAAASAAGRAFICHMPMEPEEGECGGEYCIKTGMSDSEIEESVRAALEAVPGAAGMNNHMGSKATADRRIMAAVIRACRQRNIFFLDSLTSSNSVASETAKSMGLHVLANDIFLDNRGDDIRGNMLKLMRISEKRGWAVGIMHVRSESLRELKWLVGEARKRGIDFITIEDLITLIAGKEA